MIRFATKEGRAVVRPAHNGRLQCNVSSSIMILLSSYCSPWSFVDVLRQQFKLYQFVDIHRRLTLCTRMEHAARFMACSRRRRGRDKTVLSGARRRCEQAISSHSDELISTPQPHGRNDVTTPTIIQSVI